MRESRKVRRVQLRNERYPVITGNAATNDDDDNNKLTAQMRSSHGIIVLFSHGKTK